MYELTFTLPDGQERTIRTEERYSLLMAADASGLTISTGRRAGGTCPDGKCGECRVEVSNPLGLTPISDIERAVIAEQVEGTPHEGRQREPGPPATPNTRLGCYAKVIGDGAHVQIKALFEVDSIRGQS